MMATQKTVQQTKFAQSTVNPAIAVIGIAVASIFVVAMGVHFLAPSGPSLSKGLGMSTSSFPSWVNDDAMKCQGNIGKLSADEQKKIAAQYKDGGRTEIMASYALQTHN